MTISEACREMPKEIAEEIAGKSREKYMRKLSSEPLVQFLVFGGLLYYLLVTFVASEDTSKSIHITDDILIRHMQVQAKSFNAGAAKAAYSALTTTEKDALAEDYIRGEILYREALSLGLDAGDEIIKRRLIQKMEFVHEGFDTDTAQISEDALQAHYAANVEAYSNPATITFTHIFLSAKRNAPETLGDKANSLLVNLNRTPADFESAPAYGDRFLYNRNYVDRADAEVASHFGAAFRDAVFALTPEDRWQGPIASDHGLHLVLVTHQAASSLPTLSEAAPMMLADLKRQKLDTSKRAAYEALKKTYHITRESNR